MPTNRPLATSEVKSIETAWKEGGERSAVEAIIVKYAHVLDMTDSGRDIKPLATGMLEAVDRLKEIDAASAAKTDTPLAAIMSQTALKVVNG